jgi:hypothetical protein
MSIRRARNDDLPAKEFTEPVALLSTRPADFPLPRTVSGLSFNRLTLRIFRKLDVATRPDAVSRRELRLL